MTDSVQTDSVRRFSESEGPYFEIQESADKFLSAFQDFYKAGMTLVEAWNDGEFNADEVFPLPEKLRPPMSLDEWLIELHAHYNASKETEMITAPETIAPPEWQKDGDPCNDCGEPAAYDPANGWYYHINPDAPACFLMGSGPIEGQNDPVDPEAHTRLPETNTRRGPAAGHEDEYLRRADGSIYGVKEDVGLTDWQIADANLETLPYPVQDSSGVRHLALGPDVYGLIDWDGKYRLGLYYTLDDGYDEGGICAEFERFADLVAFAERLVNIHAPQA